MDPVEALAIVAAILICYYVYAEYFCTEEFKPCIEFGCPGAPGSSTSLPPRGNVVLNDFYYPYSGAQEFERDENDKVLEPKPPAFIPDNVHGGLSEGLTVDGPDFDTNAEGASVTESAATLSSASLSAPRPVDPNTSTPSGRLVGIGGGNNNATDRIDYSLTRNIDLPRTDSNPDTNDGKLRGRTQAAHYAIQTPLWFGFPAGEKMKSEPDHIPMN